MITVVVLLLQLCATLSFFDCGVHAIAHDANATDNGRQQQQQHFVGDVNGDFVFDPATGGRVIVNGIDATQTLNDTMQLVHELEGENKQLRAMIENLWKWSEQKLSSSSSSSGNGDSLCAVAVDVMQEIPTLGAFDWEYFEMDRVAHLAVANVYDNDSNRVNSVIYRHDGTRFVAMQEIPTTGAFSWEYFEMDGVAHLAVANHADIGSTRLNSVIYRFDGNRNRFVSLQEIPTIGGYGWKYFELDGGVAHLAIANHRDNARDDIWNVSSLIYRYDGSSFVPAQEIPTFGATDWEYFELDGIAHLVVANNCDGNFRDTNYRVKSIVYRFNGAHFVPMQEISTFGAMDWEYFELGGVAHLAVANHRDGNNYHVNSVIYRFNGTSFAVMQEIPTFGAIGWEFFELHGLAYLAVANHRNHDNWRVNSVVYRYDGTRFMSAQEISTVGAHDWEYFELGGTAHLAVANARVESNNWRTNSIIYRFTAPPITDLCP